MLDVNIDIDTPCHLHVHADSDVLITGVLGPSGVGKTTLLRSLCGLHPHRGTVKVDNQPVHKLPTHRRPVTLVQQHTQLVPHWTVQQHLHKTHHSDCPLDTTGLIHDMALTPLLAHKPHQLSGGQKQRVALLLGLLRAPKLLLLDEPFTALDDTSKRQLFPILTNALRQLSARALLVSHQIRDIASLCDQVWEIKRNGTVSQHPVQEGLRHYQGNRHHDVLLSARCLGVDQHHQLVRFQIGDQILVATGQYPAVSPKNQSGSDRSNHPQAARSDTTLMRLAISADDVGISLNSQHNSSFANDLKARATKIERDNYGALIHCQVGEQTIQAHITDYSLQRLSIAEGQMVRLVFKAGAVDILGIDYSL